MGLFGTIVIGYDGTERSDGAVGLGSTLARVSGDEVSIVLAYPVTPLSARVGGGEFRDLSRQEALRRVDAARARLGGARLRHLRSTPAGTPVHALHAAAKKDGGGLIVVADSVKEGAGTPERLLRDAPAAVAVARPWTGSHPRLNRVAVALDGSDPAGAGLRVGMALAGQPDSPVEDLELLSYGDGPAPAWLIEAAAFSGGRVVREAGDPITGLLRRSRSLDLLIVGSRDLGPLRRRRSASVSVRAVRNAECPVLVVPRGVQVPREA
jgi:nucleotide-binding universal stress UspA family protein